MSQIAHIQQDIRLSISTTLKQCDKQGLCIRSTLGTNNTSQARFLASPAVAQTAEEHYCPPQTIAVQILKIRRSP
jgi:hypothetical protein